MIRSLNEFLKKYLPKRYEAEQISKMTPEEYGRWLARRSLEKAEELLR